MDVTDDSALPLPGPPTAPRSLHRFLFPVFAILLSVAIAAAYYPALSHMHRGDQWVYLLETIDTGSLGDTFWSTYSFNRTNRIFQGDTGLFRPALFFFLGFQKQLFGTNVVLWQATGMVLHGIICLVVLSIMLAWIRLIKRRCGANEGGMSARPNRLRESRLMQFLPYAAVFFFATNVNVIDAVIWSHLNSYLLFYLCVCLAIRLGLCLLDVVPPTRQRMGVLVLVVWILCLLAAFLHELGQVYAVLFGVLVATSLARIPGFKKSMGWFVFLGFAAIPVGYQTLNAADRMCHRERLLQDPENGRLLRGIDLESSGLRAARFINFTVLNPFFSPSAQVRLGKPRPKIEEVPFYEMVGTPLGAVSLLLLILSVSLIVMALLRGLARKAWTRKEAVTAKASMGSRSWTSGVFVLVLVGMVASYAGVTVLGRMNQRPHPDILAANSYYAYFPLLVFLLLICAAATEIGHGKPPGRSLGWLLDAAVGLLIDGFLLLGAVDARQVYLANKAYAKQFWWERSLVAQTRAFVAQHQQEPGFSIAFAWDRGDRGIIPCELGVPITTMMFRPYEDEYRPRYLLWFEHGKLHFAEAEKGAGLSAGGRSFACWPRLVEPGFTYNIWQYRDRFYGVLRSDGPYIPIKYHYGLIEGSTVAEVRAREEAAIASLERDARQGRFPLRFEPVVVGYKGFDIGRYGKRFYGVPHNVGAFNPELVWRGDYRPCFEGACREEVERRIDEWSRLRPATTQR